MSFDYALFIIGAGYEGITAARIAATYGAHVVISERYQMGGTCIVHGCIPEKLDKDICTSVQEGMVKNGIQFFLQYSR